MIASGGGCWLLMAVSLDAARPAAGAAVSRLRRVRTRARRTSRLPRRCQNLGHQLAEVEFPPPPATFQQLDAVVPQSLKHQQAQPAGHWLPPHKVTVSSLATRPIGPDGPRAVCGDLRDNAPASTSCHSASGGGQFAL